MRGKPITESEGKEILQELARAVEESHEEHPPIQDLLADPHVLDKYIRQVKVDWHTIAARLQMDKGKVYTWYFNTWSNKTLGARMTMEDKEIIKSSIRAAIQNNIPIDKEFRKGIYNKLSTTYHTLEVSCHVTNYLNSREAKTLMEECNFYVEKLSKHRGSSSTTTMVDNSPNHAGGMGGSSPAYSSNMNGPLIDSLRTKKGDYGNLQGIMHNSNLISNGITPTPLSVPIGTSTSSGLQSVGLSHAPLPVAISGLHSEIPISLNVNLDIGDPMMKAESDKFCTPDSATMGLGSKQFISEKGHLGYFASATLTSNGCDAGVGDSDGDDDDGDKESSRKLV